MPVHGILNDNHHAQITGAIKALQEIHPILDAAEQVNIDVSQQRNRAKMYMEILQAYQKHFPGVTPYVGT